jgi:hypothetical protein
VITTALFLDFLHCKRKAFLKGHGTPSQRCDFERVELEQDRIYEIQARERYLQSYGECRIVSDPPSLLEAMREGPRFIAGIFGTERMPHRPTPRAGSGTGARGFLHPEGHSW